MAGNRRKLVLKRRDTVASLLAGRGDALLVTGLGGTCWDAAAAGDHESNFYLWGAMGGAATLGLGLALSQPDRRVLILTGDGEMLMGLGSLATIAVQAPRNLVLVVIDNERYGETGMQFTHTHHGVDLARVASAVGFRASETIYSRKELAAFTDKLYTDRGPLFASIKVCADGEPMILPPREGPYLKDRFRRALLGEKLATE